MATIPEIHIYTSKTFFPSAEKSKSTKGMKSFEVKYANGFFYDKYWYRFWRRKSLSCYEFTQANEAYEL